ncbi:MAG: hypothetical protein ACYDCO_12110 [Armatimonadota bacterium]
MHRYLLLILITLLLPSLLPAQPNPNAGPGQPPPPPPLGQVALMPGRFGFNPRAATAEMTPNGLFLLAEGVLARYSPDLEQCVTLQLLPPMPALPVAGGDDRPAQQKWLTERALRSSPPAMLPSGELLYIVYAGNLFRVNQNTLKLEKTALDPLPEPGGEFRQQLNLSTPPLLMMQGDTLYIIRQLDLIAVDLKAFAVLKRADLPKEMAPAMPVMPGPAGLAPGGKGMPFGEGEAARAMTIVGALESRKVGEQTIYQLKDEAGVQYQLAGEQIDRLAARGDLNGKRARVTGVPERRDVPPGINSVLRVQAIQLLEE